VTILLELVNITKQFPGVLANDHISLDLKQGEIHTLLGENGAGKTTLMNILYGLLSPDEGEIYFRGNKITIGSPKEAIAHGIGMVHQHFMLVPTLTVTENIILGQELVRGPFLQKKEAAQVIEKLSSDYGLDVSPQRKVWQLSVGEQQRVEILKVLYRGAEILVLDEPTASLTPQETEIFFGILQSLIARGKSVIFISHKLDEVMQISDRITVLRRGKVVGSVERKETSDKDLACMMVGREVVLRVTGEHRNNFVEKPVASLREVTCKDERGKNVLEKLSLDLHPGEILGVAGVDGNGQTELAEMIAGLRAPTHGQILIDDQLQAGADPLQRTNLGVYYIPAERKKRGAAMSLPVMMNAILKNHRVTPYSRGGVFNHKAVRAFTEKLIQEYDVRTPSMETPTETLSGGNLQKLILGREISDNPRILIAEQPTHGLDVGAIEYVRQILLKQRDLGCAILLISADLDEIMALSDRIVVMYAGQIIYESNNIDISLNDIGLAMGGKTNS
jgi:general nucleoside transport system ATP-binding protein